MLNSGDASRDEFVVLEIFCLDSGIFLLDAGDWNLVSDEFVLGEWSDGLGGGAGLW